MVRELREWQWSTCPPDVRAKFLEFDKDRNGRLDYGELRNALQAHAAPRAAPRISAPPCLRLPLVIRAIRTSAPPGARPRHEPAARGEPARSVRQGPQRCVAPPSPPQPLVAEEAASLAPPQSTDIVLLPSPQAVRVEAPCVHHAHAAMHTTPSTRHAYTTHTTHTPRPHHAHAPHSTRHARDRGVRQAQPRAARVAVGAGAVAAPAAAAQGSIRHAQGGGPRGGELEVPPHRRDGHPDAGSRGTARGHALVGLSLARAVARADHHADE